LKRKYREAMRAANRARDEKLEYAADVLQWFDDNRERQDHQQNEAREQKTDDFHVEMTK
jgi:hypothetical protein